MYSQSKLKNICRLFIKGKKNLVVYLFYSNGSVVDSKRKILKIPGRKVQYPMNVSFRILQFTILESPLVLFLQFHFYIKFISVQ